MFQLEGKKIGVLPSNEQNSLYLGNLRKGCFHVLWMMFPLSNTNFLVVLLFPLCFYTFEVLCLHVKARSMGFFDALFMFYLWASFKILWKLFQFFVASSIAFTVLFYQLVGEIYGKGIKEGATNVLKKAKGKKILHMKKSKPMY